MNVLHVYKTYLPEDFTGIPRVIHSLAEGLAGRGVGSSVLALARRPQDGPLRIGRHIVHQVRRDLSVASTDLSVSVFRAFAKRARAADLIHYHFPWPLGDLLHLTHGRGKPAVVTYHSDVVRQRVLLGLYRPLMHNFLGNVDAIVATSPSYMESSTVLARHLGKTCAIPIGIGERTPPEPATIARWRARLGNGFILFVGTLRYYKGLSFLIEAARRCGLRVVIAGRNDREGINPDALPVNVTYVGPVQDADKEALLNLCAAFVFPSHLRSEAFGVALLESARAGKPMISCELGTGTSYVNVHGRTGIVVAPANAGALAAAMERLAADPAGAIRMGDSARRRYENLFTAERMTDGYMGVYEEVLSARKA